MNVHIKFLEHGKGSAAKASAYVLDKLDHMGNVRAGVEVLRGDATTFNAICDSSPHLWKYTSGVIAWSKEDAPTDEQIKEVLDDFEQYAFAGLEQSQYHLFAVLHTDDDGSKHIHVLTPRLDLQSGKSLNIAPPGHEKHFDSLRDYYNTKYQWSRPDDLLLMRATQEPNHIAKLNKQAKKILLNQDIETLTKNQFCKAFDNYVRALLSTQTVKNRTDLIDCIRELDGIDSIKPSKNFLAITLKNGKTHRLKGDFYHEQFEIESYTEHVRAAAESKPTADELAATLTDADQLRATYRTKREAYHRKHHAFTPGTSDDNSPRITSTLDFKRDRESITPIHQNTHNELYGANTSITSTTIEYRYIEYQNHHNQHRFVFNIHTVTTKPSPEHQDRSRQLAEDYPKPSPTSNSKAKRTDPERLRNTDHRKVEQPKSSLHIFRSLDIHSVDDFNHFIFGLSNQLKTQNNRSTTTDHSTELKNDYQPNQLFKQSTAEIRHADRNRSFFARTKRLIERAKRFIDSTNQLVNRAKQRIESTSQFIKKHLEQIQRSRAEFTKQNQQLECRERSPTSFDFSAETGAFKARAGQLFGAVTASISKQCADPITDAINTSFEASEFKQHCHRLSENRIEPHSIEYQHTTGRSRESTLENLATECTSQLLRRSRDAKRADQYAWEDGRKINQINQQLERLEKTVEKIRLKPEPATDFHLSSLRSDNLYQDCVRNHNKQCEKQQQAFKNNDVLLLIKYTHEKAESLRNGCCVKLVWKPVVRMCSLVSTRLMAGWSSLR
jgi:hypothetical protein